MILNRCREFIVGGKGRATAAVFLKAIAAGTALLLQLLIARYLGAETTGLYALMTTTTALLATGGMMGQDTILVRDVAASLAQGDSAEARAATSTSIRIALVGTVLAAAALVCAAFYYRWELSSSDALWMLLLAVPACISISLGRIFSSASRGAGLLLRSQLGEGPLTSFLALLLTTFLILTINDSPAWALAVVYSASTSTACFLNLYYYKAISRGWPAARFRGRVKRSLADGAPVLTTNVAAFATDWAVVVSVSLSSSLGDAGAYRIISLYVMVMYLIVIAIDSVISPDLARAFRLQDLRRSMRLYRMSIAGSLAFSSPALLLALFAPEWILSWFGPEFVSAAPALQLGAILQACALAVGPAGTALIMAGHQRLIWPSLAGGTVVLVSGCLLLVPHYGVWGGVAAGSGTLLARRVLEFVLMTQVAKLQPWR